MQKFNKNAGFGVIGTILVIIVILAVGLISWRVLDAMRNKQDSTNSESNTTDQSKTSIIQEDVNYLDIKELGVKVKLNDDIKDAIYYFNSATASTEPTVRLSSQSLTDKSDGACDPSKVEALGSIYKTDDLTLPTGATLSVNNTNVFQLGASYYVYVSPSSPCSLDPAISGAQISQLQAVKEAVKTIQLDQ